MSKLQHERKSIAAFTPPVSPYPPYVSINQEQEMVEVTVRAQVEAPTYLTLYRHDGEPGRQISPLDGLPEFVGEYHDLFTRTPDGWRFKSRTFVGAFAQARRTT